jgi:hypothetical protein
MYLVFGEARRSLLEEKLILPTYILPIPVEQIGMTRLP